MKTYTFELIIREGNDEFWEGIEGAGCDEVTDNIKACLDEQGWLNRGTLTLKKYEDESEDHET